MTTRIRSQHAAWMKARAYPKAYDALKKEFSRAGAAIEARMRPRVRDRNA